MTPAELEAIRGRATAKGLRWLDDSAQAHEDRAALLSEVGRLRGVLEGIRDDARTARHSRVRTGMQVPYHGPWATTVRTPSGERNVRDLQRLCERVLDGEP